MARKKNVGSGWVVSWWDDETEMSRSRKLGTEDEADRFKALVEAGRWGDSYPGVAALVKNGLQEHVQYINPMILLAIVDLIDKAVTPDFAVASIKKLAFKYGDPSRLLSKDEWPSITQILEGRDHE